ncbi:hypothetical protein ACFE04_004107 [Oxalis oulophora]
MATDVDNYSPLPFPDFPIDIQVTILSFLSPIHLINFACTSKRFDSLCRNDAKLWSTMCDRRFGAKTQISNWGCGKISYKLLYQTLHRYENLLGLWRRCGVDWAPSLRMTPLSILFEWGPSFLTGSWVENCEFEGECDAVKLPPFLFMGISSDGKILNYVDLDGRIVGLGEFVSFSQLGVVEKDLVLVNVNFIEKDHLLVKENNDRSSVIKRCSSGGEDVEDGGSCGLLDQFVPELYIQLANKTSPSARRRRKERERLGKKKWEIEHFLRIS